MLKILKILLFVIIGVVLAIIILAGALWYWITATYNDVIRIEVSYSHNYCANAQCEAVTVQKAPESYLFLKEKPLLVFSDTLHLENIFYGHEDETFCLEGKAHRFDTLRIPGISPDQEGRGFRVERALPGQCILLETQ